MDRREMLQSAAAVALAAVAASTSSAEEHSHHHGGGSKFQPLIDTTGSCIAKGEACLAHCLILLGDGDKVMAECAKSVNQMLAICNSLQNLAAQGSRLTKIMAKIAQDACTECEKECKKHADKHAECKVCMEACADCAKQCEAFSA